MAKVIDAVIAGVGQTPSLNDLVQAIDTKFFFSRNLAATRAFYLFVINRLAHIINLISIFLIIKFFRILMGSEGWALMSSIINRLIAIKKIRVLKIRCEINSYFWRAWTCITRRVITHCIGRSRVMARGIFGQHVKDRIAHRCRNNNASLHGARDESVTIIFHAIHNHCSNLVTGEIG